MRHYLKLLDRFCDAVYDGEKTFEVRRNDRDFRVGDEVVFEPIYENYMSYSHPIQDKVYKITYILNGGNFGVDKDYCVFGIAEI